MSGDTAKTSKSPSLSDKDIATYRRRSGPSGGGPGTDADSHTDTDTQAKPATDTDIGAARPATDEDAT